MSTYRIDTISQFKALLSIFFYYLFSSILVDIHGFYLIFFHFTEKG
tara:strand:- start:242 stop:379 length:138 start_codon:yes stop_codon:yes gene_type:complete